MSDELRAGPADDPDRYRLYSVAAAGSEGRVYRSVLEVSDGFVDVAVKMMRPERFDAHEPAEVVVRRWIAQAARLRNLNHPGLVGVQEAFLGPAPHRPGDAGADEPCAYFVMAWVDGPDLTSWVADRPSLLARLRVLDNVADALDHLHAHDLVHADVKPGNVLVRNVTLPTGAEQEAAVLVDFGVMRAITGTTPSQLVVSRGYAAPELLEGGPYGPLTDLYAFGGVVLFSLTGDHPPSGGTSPARVVAEARGRLLELGVSVPTVDAVASALDPAPDKRPGSGCSAWLASARNGLSSSAAGRMTAAAFANGRIDAVRTGTTDPGVAAPADPIRADAAVGTAVSPSALPPHDEGEAEAVTLPRAVPRLPRPVQGPPSPPPTPWFRRWRWRIVPAVGVVVLAAVLTYVVLTRDGSPGGSGADTPQVLSELVGEDVEDARAALDGAGSEVDVTETIDESEPEGTVLDAEERSDGTIVLTVARRPVSRYLADLDPVDLGPGVDHRFGAFALSGDRYAEALRISLDPCGEVARIDYDLGRDFRRLVATVGLDDRSAASAELRFEVFLDGERVSDSTLGLGDTAPLDLDVTGALRLRLQARLAEAGGGCVTSAAAVVADPHLLGVPWELETSVG